MLKTELLARAAAIPLSFIAPDTLRKRVHSHTWTIEVKFLDIQIIYGLHSVRIGTFCECGILYPRRVRQQWLVKVTTIFMQTDWFYIAHIFKNNDLNII